MADHIVKKAWFIHEFHLKGRQVNTDRGYDSDQNCQMVFMHGMISNSKQRKDAVNRSKPSRRKAATMFNPNKYALSDTESEKVPIYA